MVLSVSVTEDNVKRYPLHTHSHFEIMYYIEGDGFLHTPERDYPFSPGTSIIVPGGILHGSVSKSGFKNISVGGDFSHLLMFDRPKVVQDNGEKEGEFLAQAILRNRSADSLFLESLTETYIKFLLKNTLFENGVIRAVSEICRVVTENACDCGINITKILNSHGYAEDYIRMCFTKQIGMPPLKYLNKVRIDRAKSLINIYKNEIPLSTIAEKCGFQDYAYFSRKFKENTGLSPQKFLQENSL